MALILALLSAIVIAAAGWAEGPDDGQTPMAQLPDWVFDGSSDLPEVPEPSGLCYCPTTDSLFIVDDGAEDRPCAVYELDLHAKVLNSHQIGMDLEGICYCSKDDLLYVADEADEVVYVMMPEGLKQIGQFSFSPDFDGKTLLQPGGNGIEGIEYIPGDDGGYFLLLNQDDPPALVKITYAEAQKAIMSGKDAPLDAWWPLPAINLGELYYDQDAHELWVVHSWMNVMEILDVPSMKVKRWEVIPFSAQEAVTVDGQGRLWIGADSGGIDRYVRPDSQSEPATE